MFNPLTPAEMVSAVGRAARAAAHAPGGTADFTRSQLMSAYSATRHLAVEMTTSDAELRTFRNEVAASVRRADLEGRLSGHVAAIEEATDAREVGSAICELLDVLRDEELRVRVHTLVARLVDREVDLLADGLDRS